MSGDAGNTSTYVPFQTRLREGDVSGILAGVEWDVYEEIAPEGTPISLVSAVIGRTHVKGMVTRPDDLLTALGIAPTVALQVDQHATDAEALECHSKLAAEGREMAVLAATDVTMREITREYGDELGII